MTSTDGSGFRDHDDRPAGRPEPPTPDEPPYWEAIGDFQGAAYRRNAFARSTAAEIDALWRRLDLRPSVSILDVGCGNGRHLVAAAHRGATGLGVDISQGLVDAATQTIAADRLEDQVRVVRGDARELDRLVEPGSFDVAWSLSQGGLGTDPGADAAIVAGMARSVRPGGQVAVTLFHALFVARHLAPGDAFDPDRLLHHHVDEVRGPDDERRSFDLWTTAYTARGARRLCRDAGLEVVSVSGAAPGRYDATGLGLDDPELLVLCHRP
ncbi:MAG: class I SAM-dependent methyltransferase [Nitriliruptorales bacterium]|nr:class I SAM-dependent methyltransferase [Nitriliruptorales bacterium]